METIEKVIKCTECMCVLESPVILPCSDLICKKHVKEEAREFHCLACDIIHPVPSGGFPVNKALGIMLDQKIQNNRFLPEYHSAFDSFKNLGKAIDEAKLFQKDPPFFIKKVSNIVDSNLLSIYGCLVDILD
jgi:hypothetical protein